MIQYASFLIDIINIPYMEYTIIEIFLSRNLRVPPLKIFGCEKINSEKNQKKEPRKVPLQGADLLFSHDDRHGLRMPVDIEPGQLRQGTDGHIDHIFMEIRRRVEIHFRR